jgi:hypothetical protein
MSSILFTMPFNIIQINKGKEFQMVTKVNFNDCSGLPEPVRRKMGIGTSSIKVVSHEEGET